jgi:hypothetical protein
MKRHALSKISPRDLAFYHWHDADARRRAQLRDWLSGMQPVRDGEQGSGPDGARVWFDAKIVVSDPGGLFQSFLGEYRNEVVWTGSVVADDRGARNQLTGMGYAVEAFFGLFNTRHDLRGRGIGWSGACHVARHVSEQGNPSVALFTANPAAERHYEALGFRRVGAIAIPGLAGTRRLYIRPGNIRPCNTSGPKG